MLSVEPRNTYGYKDFVIYAYEYRGTTTQKQCSRFIKEFCGNNYCKAYKIARYYMRRYKCESMLLVSTDTKTKFLLTMYKNGRVLKDMYIFIWGVNNGYYSKQD